MFKIIHFAIIFSLILFPVLAYAQNSTQKDEQNINISIETSPKIEKLLEGITQSQQLQDERFNQLIIELKSELKPQEITFPDEEPWNEGDVIVASSTIVAFFGFSALFTMRFKTTQTPTLVNLLKGNLMAIFGIQILHLIVIIFIMMDEFSEEFYTFIIIVTILLLIILVAIYRELLHLEYSAKKTRATLDDIKMALELAMKMSQGII